MATCYRRSNLICGERRKWKSRKYVFWKSFLPHVCINCYLKPWGFKSCILCIRSSIHLCFGILHILWPNFIYNQLLDSSSNFVVEYHISLNLRKYHLYHTEMSKIIKLHCFYFHNSIFIVIKIHNFF
jgi:hypothetical protein